MVYLFLDTNILIHCKPFKEIKWGNYTKADFRIVLAPIVIDELDKHKYNPKAKLAKKAKQVLSDLEKIMDDENENKINILVTRPQRSSFDRFQFDPKQQDDTLMLSIIEFSEQHPEDKVFLVTNDLGPKLKAKTVGIAILILSDSEKLPQEPDENEKELIKVQKELQNLKNLIPKVDLYFQNKANVRKFIAPLQPPDFETFQKSKMLLIRKMNPYMAKNEKDLYKNPLAGMREYQRAMGGITDYTIDQHNKSLDKFYKDYEKYIHELYTFENDNQRSILIQLHVINDGNTPAKDIDIKLYFPSFLEVSVEKNTPVPPKEPLAPKQGDVFSSSFAALPDFRIVTITEMIKTSREAHDLDGANIQIGKEIMITFHQDQLKHLQTKILRTIMAKFNSVSEMVNFSINYELNISNVTTAIRGKLNIVIDQRNNNLPV
ncbi:PIN domain-containing protein [Mucilaginibacter sp. E4BP6]|uniref:PIN domain-containing protein n=1 Tax=Mucilaginibacter sp. E4BP6 TaxID=2723089 RepID=UPI0015C88F90|nr:PIN domain-containing protein [Mucilaginibacter sp. E4BP6]NYE65262.1 rRNA-processing protein FCF1 [Mucilaginibacter sp. E4BP6]